MRRLNSIGEYRKLFGAIFPDVKAGRPITIDMFGRAIAEFENTLIFANAPIDEFARGDKDALTNNQKRGALLFFGKAGCVNCHAVSGQSNEMFSDFREHVIGVPANRAERLQRCFRRAGPERRFRTGTGEWPGSGSVSVPHSPLRNAALQPAYFHNGCFTSLEAAIRHHLDVFKSARTYTWPADLAHDLTAPRGPIEPVLAKVDPLLTRPIPLSDSEFKQLADFVRNGLLDEAAKPENLRKLIPKSVPSGRPVLKFEF